MENRLETLNGVITTKATAYAKAYNEGGHKKSELSALKKAANEAVKNYNSELEKATYRQWNAEGDAVKTAVRMGYIPHAKKLQFKTDDDNYMTVVLNEADYEINLPMMQATLGTGVFNDARWFNKCEKLALMVVENLISRIGGGANVTYKVQDASRAFSFPDGVDVLSDEGIGIAMQEVIDAILFIDDPDAPGMNLIRPRMITDNRGVKAFDAWEYVRNAMVGDDSSEANRTALKVVNTGKFSVLIARAMHTILTNGVFMLNVDGAFEMPKADDEHEPETTEETSEE